MSGLIAAEHDINIDAYNTFIGRPIEGSESTAAQIERLMKRNRNEKPKTDHLGRLVLHLTKRRAVLASPSVVQGLNDALEPSSPNHKNTPMSNKVTHNAHPNIVLLSNGLRKVVMTFEGRNRSTLAWETDFIAGRLRNNPQQDVFDDLRDVLLPPITGLAVVDTFSQQEAEAVVQVLRTDFPEGSVTFEPAQVISIPAKV